MIVGIDVDGVLANFFKPYEELTVSVAGNDLFPARYPDALPQTWNWPESFGYTKDTMSEVWKRIKADPFFWSNMESLPGADEFLSALGNKANEYYFITDRPGNNPQHQTAEWLVERGITCPSVIISRNGKGSVCSALKVDVYLDDKPENIVDVRQKSPLTRPYLLSYPYNAAYDIDFGDGRRIDSIAEFLEVI